MNVILFAIFLLNSSYGITFMLEGHHDRNTIEYYVCKIANDILKSSNDTQDVMIGNLGGKTKASITNNVADCIERSHAVVMSDFRKPIVEKQLRKASVVILVFKLVNKKTIQEIVLKHHFGTVWHHMTKVLCIVPDSVSYDERIQLLVMFADYGFLDVALSHTTITGDFQFESFASVKRVIHTEINPSNSSLIFPDKLKNMEEHQYRVIIYHQEPRVQIINYQIKTPILHFLDSLLTAQNAKFHTIYLEDATLLATYWMRRKMDLTLNSDFFIESTEPKLLTYEEESFCVLVPLPPKTRIPQLIFIKPFDGLTWLFLLLTLSACTVVWWMFRGRGAVDSPWLVAYGMFVMLIGQGVDFSSKNRMVLVILLQLIIVMMFVLNNAYDGVITSFMITPIHEHRLKTFEGVVASDYEFQAGTGFLSRLKDSKEHALIEPRTNIFNDKNVSFASMIKMRKIVLILKCDVAEDAFQGNELNAVHLPDYFYLLPQKLFSTYVRLEASYLNPFLERIQYYMDLCFQAGLMQIWKTMDGLNNYVKVEELDEVEYLYLRDLSQVFGVLIIGYALSTVLLLIEIFFCDFFNNLKFAHLGQRLRNKVHNIAYKKRNQPKDIEYQRGALYYIIHRHQKLKRLKPRRLKVREIFVRPINAED